MAGGGVEAEDLAAGRLPATCDVMQAGRGAVDEAIGRGAQRPMNLHVEPFADLLPAQACELSGVGVEGVEDVRIVGGNAAVEEGVNWLVVQAGEGHAVAQQVLVRHGPGVFIRAEFVVSGRDVAQDVGFAGK